MSTHDDDTDPTGMRALLRALPDPGPMPDDLADRIRASLSDLSLDEETPPVSSVGVTSVSRGTVRPGIRSWWSRHGSKVAVAAVVLIGGSSVAGLVGSGFGSGAGSDSAGSSADSAAGSAESRSLADEGKTAASQGDSDGQLSGRDLATGPVVVTMSGRAYTAAGLAGQLGEAGRSAPLTPLTAESPGIGPIGTEIGVRSCLEALGLPPDTRADVDLGPVDGTPAAVIVVGTDGARTAYAVRRECTLGNPAILVGPIDLP
ncbi:hypothetical protein [Knoellia sinensis]|uniref:hypothetical protein n=1 Tax=Knoellia sinensis TaxID=136100 RepID=UPI0012ECA074|nr:hypothetical protein [Knoellia sinensis]